MHHNFPDYRPLKSAAPGRSTGVYLSKNTARRSRLLDRRPVGDAICGRVGVAKEGEGQIVGEHGCDNDMVGGNVTDPKPLTNTGVRQRRESRHQAGNGLLDV